MTGMSLVSINDVLKITTRVEKIHPYKVFGDRDSYSPYNEGWSDCVSLIESYLEKLPSAEPERKKGKWVTHEYPDKRESYYIQCDCCGKVAIWTNGYSYKYPNYCPNCGADMRGDHE